MSSRLVTAAVIAAWAAAASAPPAHARPVRAVRTPTAPVLDGRLDDPVWALAPVHTGFIQRTPDEGRPASEETDLRVVYDDAAIYFGLRCHDRHAAIIRPQLARRDSVAQLNQVDMIGIALDTVRDRRSAMLFLVTPAGVQVDASLTEGTERENFDWDGVWYAETSRDAGGWSVEIAIPLSTLRFPGSGAPQTWGLIVRRRVNRTKEESEWTLIRPGDTGIVARMGDLVGIEGVSPGLALDLTPYAAAAWQPRFAEDSLTPRERWRPQLGVDLKYGLGGALTLDATLLPDFGQVEVDPAVVNLTAFEAFFPEKRPFFMEGASLFGAAAPYVYTRRIGAGPSAPAAQGGQIVSLDQSAQVMGAAKISGSLRPGTAVAWLGAYVDGADAVERIEDASGAATLVRRRASPRTYFNAARIRQIFGASGASSAGATVTSVVRGQGSADANVVEGDVEFRRGGGDYSLTASGAWTFTPACDEANRAPARAGRWCDAGAALLTGGKTSGSVRIFDEVEYVGAEHDPNDMGFLPHLNGNRLLKQTARVRYVHPAAWRAFQQLAAELEYLTGWDTAADPSVSNPLVQHKLGVQGAFRLRNQWTAALFVGHGFPAFDHAETRLNPKVRLYRRPHLNFMHARVTTSDARPIWADAVLLGALEAGGLSARPSLGLTALAGGRLELGANVAFQRAVRWRRWIGTGSDGAPVMAQMDQRQLEVTGRAQVAFNRSLTLQLFGHLLRSEQTHLQPTSLIDPWTTIPCDDAGTCGRLAEPGAADGDVTSFIANAVVRWEWRPGSALYLVGTHRQLGDGIADDVVLAKVSWLFGL